MPITEAPDPKLRPKYLSEIPIAAFKFHYRTRGMLYGGLYAQY